MKENFFAAIAKEYARLRPRYPEALFTYLASVAPSRQLAWDCATGTGRSASALVEHFDSVVATDISEELMGQAEPQERIAYRKADALASGLDAGSIDLITVANAMHWFHGEPFVQEVRRVLKPGGVIAAWSFAFAQITPEVDRLTRKLHSEIVDPFWIEPNRIVEHGYKDLHFPFDPIDPPAFDMISRMDLDSLEGYLRTWSASTKFRAARGIDPIGLVHEELLIAWGDPAKVREVHWTLNLRVGH
ncbi:MAG: class I SAM-dependent methyltransferase [Flavobacteriales bacterium]|nr:class I SAM-dependent methyltransferase [Flavobacteriales bacterium]